MDITASYDVAERFADLLSGMGLALITTFYGVFMAWDNDSRDGQPDDGVNDMYVAALGAFVVRVHKDETVAIGDYLVSNGDGTAKKQADDILRASTIAKVTSTTKTHIHADSSYCVPCTLHCG